MTIHTGVLLQSYLGLAIRSTHRWGEHRLSAEEGLAILPLQPGPQRLDLGAVIGLRFGFSGHLNHGAYLRGSYSARFRLRWSSQVAPKGHLWFCLGTDRRRWVGYRQAARLGWTCDPAPSVRRYPRHRNQRRLSPLPTRLCPGLCPHAGFPSRERADPYTPEPDPTPLQ